MKIVADQNMPALDETFGLHGELLRIEGRAIRRSHLRDADVLLVRSVTPVNADLLQGTNVRFVGSATIGIDHLDTSWLEENDIAWAHAPGCNADAAAQYTLAMMWLACQRLDRDFHQQRVGIIGRGNVGRRLEHLLTALDIPVGACDPPLQDLGHADQCASKLVSMQQACSNSIISLHVPLTDSGKYPTREFFNQKQLAALEHGTLLVNASRGGVIEKAALLAQLKAGALKAALDVWPDEPFIDRELLHAVTVATPHIAGYSREGKHAGTEMIYLAFQNIIEQQQAKPSASDTNAIELNFTPTSSSDEVLNRLLNSSCPVARDDAALRALPQLPGGHDRIQIDNLRSSYPERREFKSHSVSGLTGKNTDLLRAMGFRTM